MNEPPRDALCRVMDAMDKAGITRGDLISRGIASRNALQQTFCRRRPLSQELLVKIAGALGVPAEDLQGEDERP
jgi:transcriptional regulator with XRE-family HTH domain